MTTEEHLNRIVAKCRELLKADAGSDRAKAGWRATIAAIDSVKSAPHERLCSAVKGPEPETWLVESDCDCWKKDATRSLIAAWPQELL